MGKPQVVITRKDKRLNKAGHLIAFAATGGAGAVYTAGRAAANAGYNARTRQLADGDDAPQQPASSGAIARMVAPAQARRELGIPASVPWRKLTREQKRDLKERQREIMQRPPAPREPGEALEAGEAADAMSRLSRLYGLD